jgi:hypothetical protein
MSFTSSALFRYSEKNCFDYTVSFVVRNRKLPPLSERLSKTTEIEKTTLDIEEDGVKLRYLYLI